MLLEVGRGASGEGSVLVASLFSQCLRREAGHGWRAVIGHRAQARPAKLRAGVAARWGRVSVSAQPPSCPAGGCKQQCWGWRRGWPCQGRAVAAALGSGAQSAVHCIYLYINKDSSAVMLQ